MKSILEEIYDGNIFPDELIISKDSEYHTLNEKITDTMKAWGNKLSEEDLKQLEVLLDLRSESSGMEVKASFMYGFKLGALIIIEVLTGKDELVRDRK